MNFNAKWITDRLRELESFKYIDESDNTLIADNGYKVKLKLKVCTYADVDSLALVSLEVIAPDGYGVMTINSDDLKSTNEIVTWFIYRRNEAQEMDWTLTKEKNEERKQALSKALGL